jgi:hypothetical protein
MACCPGARLHAESKSIVRDVGLRRSVFRRAIAWKLGARPQGSGVPGWVGPGRKGWFLKALHPSRDPFCTIPVRPAPESDAVLLNRTPVGWLTGFLRFRPPGIPIDHILTYDIIIDIIAVCLRYLGFSRRGSRSLQNFKL